MLEITGDDVAALNDRDLRTLVGRLCEAELRHRNLDVSSVTWGGNQTAKDGGIDARVSLRSGTSIDGFIPKFQSGFQVKKSDMPRAAILKEMKPKGKLRSEIRELHEVAGAYVIVSSGAATSDSALQRRKAAMLDAIAGLDDPSRLTLEFYDRNRLATWVRHHPCLIPWIRSAIGKPLSGWRSYGSWSHLPEGADHAYLVDDTARIKAGRKDEGDGLSATDGINNIREALRSPGRVVRLVGLSGVGKTRLAEALFDSAVGMNALDPNLAIYTDVADGPDPQPIGLASELIAQQRRAVLVIDNCPSELHHRLSLLVRSGRTTVSVITVEYDIRDDQPEGTHVYMLETSSIPLIEKLLSKRFSALSAIDIRTIAEFSGGNARIALALASTVGVNETVSQLADEDLLRRLFRQRNDPDDTLQTTAEACSLVYSFDGESLTGDLAELPLLGALVAQSAEQMFRGIAELRRRDLVQARGPWRAVLPPAIANRLAAAALQNVPMSVLHAGIVQNGSPRLLQSFSRRLGYLDGSREAERIVENWLAPEGLLGDIDNLGERGLAMFRNVAPVKPDAVLSALERSLLAASAETYSRCQHFIQLIRSLAYEPTYFSRAVRLLIQLARKPSEDREANEATKVIESLFTIFFSGTLAGPELRLEIVGRLLRSRDAHEQHLGVRVFGAMLRTGNFSSCYGFEFGGRSRGYGYHPKTANDVRDWFKGALSLAESFALQDGSLAKSVRAALASEFRGLWTHSGQSAELDRVSRAIAAKGFWREGWISARETLLHDGRVRPAKGKERLVLLESVLRPKDLVERVRGVVMGASHGLDFEDVEELRTRDYAGASARVAAKVEQLGRDVAIDDAAFTVLLPELIRGEGRLVGFGQGIGLESPEPRRVWQAVSAELAVAENPNVDFLCGLLNGIQQRDDALANALLDEAIDDPTLSKWVPILQRSVPIDERALGRLHQSLHRDAAPVSFFAGLAYGRTSDFIPGPQLKNLLLAIAEKPAGLAVALQILSMRLYSDSTENRTLAAEVVEVGRLLLSKYQFRKERRAIREDHELGMIVRASLVDHDGKPIVRRLCRDLLAGVKRYAIYAHDYGELIRGMFQVHPTDVLDELFAGDQKARSTSVRLLDDLIQFRQSPMPSVPDETLLGWCDQEPTSRYPFAASIALLFHRPDEKMPHEWTKIANKLLARAPDPFAILKEIVNRLDPTSWSGSLATKLESRLKLLERLETAQLSNLAVALENAKIEIRSRIETERRRETEEEKGQSGRFE